MQHRVLAALEASKIWRLIAVIGVRCHDDANTQTRVIGRGASYGLGDQSHEHVFSDKAELDVLRLSQTSAGGLHFIEKSACGNVTAEAFDARKSLNGDKNNIEVILGVS